MDSKKSNKPIEEDLDDELFSPAPASKQLPLPSPKASSFLDFLSTVSSSSPTAKTPSKDTDIFSIFDEPSTSVSSPTKPASSKPDIKDLDIFGGF